MTSPDILTIPEPSERVLLHALETFPCQVPVDQRAHVTWYAAGNYPGAPRPPKDISYGAALAFLEGCDSAGYQPTQVTLKFDPTRKLFLPDGIELLLDPNKIADDLVERLTSSLRGARRPFSTRINLSGYHPTQGSLNYQALTELRNREHQTETVGALFLPLDIIQTGPNQGDDSPANALEYYGEDLMIRNEHGQRPISDQARTYFSVIQQRFSL